MKTRLRTDLKKSNPYWISENRYRELRYFCLQYKEWKELYLYAQNPQSVSFTTLKNLGYTGSSVEKIFEMTQVYRNRMIAVKESAKEADPYLSSFIFVAVTEDKPFTYLETMMAIPCSKKMYYSRYHKFFYILDQRLMEREKQCV